MSTCLHPESMRALARPAQSQNPPPPAMLSHQQQHLHQLAPALPHLALCELAALQRTTSQPQVRPAHWPPLQRACFSSTSW